MKKVLRYARRLISYCDLFVQTLNITRQLKTAKQTTAIDSHTLPYGSTKTDLCVLGIGLLASIMMLMPIH